MARGNGQRGQRSAAAFTLIEILAVVAILALMTTFVLPNVGAMRERALRNEAGALAAQLELARQRAVVTGIPHRLLIDLESGGYRLEWLAQDSEQSATRIDGPPEYDVRGGTPLPLAAPQATRLDYQPVPGNLGDFHYLSAELGFAGMQTPEGWIERGDSFIGFDRDGTASYTEISIEDTSGRRIALDVLPLADAVRVRDVEL
ncbi:MAG: prepilin-type N-terminal cleavage/methylation domain-containing protein [Myxococcales bacterium]|nr:prepilin-type N-terminal cleavage/methylation domain-containing protein [Myxococcales bacterium]MDH5308272.1 prepilin-type N-terminal cleavage/methylation domain-containing protein [Myxococcales bacterium]MDH5567105.1 prepilin-type N-terminal cleavage/methylation domain-containing protein [Myxococcales bacterium]